VFLPEFLTVEWIATVTGVLNFLMRQVEDWMISRQSSNCSKLYHQGFEQQVGVPVV
jgi:hypothetical protein